jgi:hypothetical protein
VQGAGREAGPGRLDEIGGPAEVLRRNLVGEVDDAGRRKAGEDHPFHHPHILVGESEIGGEGDQPVCHASAFQLSSFPAFQRFNG